MDAESEFGPPLVSHGFRCSKCESVAGTLGLFGTSAKGCLECRGFIGTCMSPLEGRRFEDAVQSLEKGDVKRMYEIDRELTAFFCPKCESVYCANHWTIFEKFDEDGWHDSTRGICPQGHGTMLLD